MGVARYDARVADADGLVGVAPFFTGVLSATPGVLCRASLGSSMPAAARPPITTTAISSDQARLRPDDARRGCAGPERHWSGAGADGCPGTGLRSCLALRRSRNRGLRARSAAEGSLNFAGWRSSASMSLSRLSMSSGVSG